MANNNPITHEGNVQSVEGNTVVVKLKVESACAACHAKGICGAAESQDKVVRARNVNDEHFETGERVRVELRQTLAMKAVVICYLLPFLVLMATFCTMSYFVKNELICVGVSLAAIVAYYFIIWLCHTHIERNFTCYVTKIEQD